MSKNMIPESPILQIQDLSVVYKSEGKISRVLNNINLELGQSQIYGLVGESGSGKTTLGLTIMGYLSKEGQVTRGSIKLESLDLISLSNAELRKIWGQDLSFVPQDPFNSLNPTLQIGEQFSEVFGDKTRTDAAAEVIKWLEKVQLPDPVSIMGKYPHELSGGQKQRILIAMALSTNPKLLILDEPTTSLDVTTEAVVLDILHDLIQEQGTSVLYITHNLAIIAAMSDRVAVLYAGEVVEDGPTNIIYSQPLHPYTQGLINSLPELGVHKDRNQLSGIPGQIPSSLDQPNGCIFAPRCQFKIDLCTEQRPALERISPNQSIRCHRWKEIQEGDISLHSEMIPAEAIPVRDTRPVLHVKDLIVSYDSRAQNISSLLGKRKRFNAVNGVELLVDSQQTLGIVGESGSGKSSLAQSIMGLIEGDAGEIHLLDLNLPPSLRHRNKDIKRKLQMVFQNLDEAFPPYQTLIEVMQRPLVNLLGMKPEEAISRAEELLKMVHIPSDYFGRRPDQLSGGEKQRVKIAQALAANPKLLIADEPVSALDVSIQASILNLLNRLQQDFNTANILISHDIAVISYMADEIAVMYLGQVMQHSDVQTIFQPPYHPYTEALLSSIPGIYHASKKEPIRLDGDVPNPLERPGGCPFHTRCHRYIGEICKLETPRWNKTRDGKEIYCHIPVEELESEQEILVNISPGVDS